MKYFENISHGRRYLKNIFVNLIWAKLIYLPDSYFLFYFRNALCYREERGCPQLNPTIEFLRFLNTI